VKYSFKSLRCSIDGASQETYSQYRINGNFEQVIANIRTLNKFKESYGTRYPKLTWQFIVFGFNEDEIHKAEALACELDMTFSIKLSWNESFSPIKNTQAIREKIGYANREEWKKNKKTDYKQTICYELWHQPQINWDGKVLGCCRNFWVSYPGNVFTDDLITALNSKELNYARGMLLGLKEPLEGIPCSTCSIYKSMRKNSVYLKPRRLYFLLRAISRKIRLQFYP